MVEKNRILNNNILLILLCMSMDVVGSYMTNGALLAPDVGSILTIGLLYTNKDRLSNVFLYKIFTILIFSICVYDMGISLTSLMCYISMNILIMFILYGIVVKILKYKNNIILKSSIPLIGTILYGTVHIFVVEPKYINLGLLYILNCKIGPALLITFACSFFLFLLIDKFVNEQ